MKHSAVNWSIEVFFFFFLYASSKKYTSHVWSWSLQICLGMNASLFNILSEFCHDLVDWPSTDFKLSFLRNKAGAWTLCHLDELLCRSMPLLYLCYPSGCTVLDQIFILDLHDWNGSKILLFHWIVARLTVHGLQGDIASPDYQLHPSLFCKIPLTHGRSLRASHCQGKYHWHSRRSCPQVC
jgi:hypothetical protein